MTEEVPSATGHSTPSNNDASKQYQSKRRVFKKPVTKAPQFEGKCAKLNGHTYDCSDPRQTADIYAKTTREIGEYYVGGTYKYGADIRQAIETLAVPTLTEPTDPPTEATRSQIRIWEKRIYEFLKKETHLEENIKTVYSLIFGQTCSSSR